VKGSGSGSSDTSGGRPLDDLKLAARPVVSAEADKSPKADSTPAADTKRPKRSAVSTPGDDTSTSRPAADADPKPDPAASIVSSDAKPADDSKASAAKEQSKPEASTAPVVDDDVTVELDGVPEAVVTSELSASDLDGSLTDVLDGADADVVEDPPMAAAAAVTGELSDIAPVSEAPPKAAEAVRIPVIPPAEKPDVRPGEAVPDGPPSISVAPVEARKVDGDPTERLPGRLETREEAGEPPPYQTELEAHRREAEERAEEAASTSTFAGPFGRRRRLQSRKVRRVVRHIDPWSVLTFSVLFHLCVFAALLLASVLVWNAAEASGTIENLEALILDLGDYETFEIDGDAIFRAAVAIAGILTLASSVLLVLLTVVFNLISDLVGGIRVTVIEEETVRIRQRDEA
jgi:hypothetical protein